jgi:hypothetical protein
MCVGDRHQEAKMARSIVTSFTLARDARIRIAGGDVQFVAGDKIYDNVKYQNSWHNFPAGTRFDVAAMVDQTDTYLLIATEAVPVEGKDADGNPTITRRKESFGIFARKMSYEKLMAAAAEKTVEPVPATTPSPEAGTATAENNKPEEEETKSSRSKEAARRNA